MKSKVTILGSNSAMPAYGRKPSSHFLNINNQTFLIDCGEGAQFMMNDLGLKKSKISHIFITHLHGDHVFGLPGLLTSYELLGRRAPLTIFGPAPLKQYVEMTVNGLGHRVNYPLVVIELTDDDKYQILDHKAVEVYSFPLVHRISCVGYLFIEKPKRRNLKRSIINEFKPSVEQIKKLLAGSDLELKDGNIISGDSCFEDVVSPRSYAYCSDTLYDVRVADYVKDVHTIYHESTYLHDMQEKARERFHSTSIEAAKIAALAGAEQLVLGHYSSRYQNLLPFKEEAETVFQPVILAKEGRVIEI